MKLADLIGSDLKGESVLPYLIEIELVDNGRNSVSSIHETLTRIGVSKPENRTAPPNVFPKRQLRQTVHLYEHGGKLYLAHFKMMFILFGGENTIALNDLVRYNAIALLLEHWGLVKFKNPEIVDRQCFGKGALTIISFHEKTTWSLKQVFQTRKAFQSHD